MESFLVEELPEIEIRPTKIGYTKGILKPKSMSSTFLFKNNNIAEDKISKESDKNILTASKLFLNNTKMKDTFLRKSKLDSKNSTKSVKIESIYSNCNSLFKKNFLQKSEGNKTAYTSILSANTEIKSKKESRTNFNFDLIENLNISKIAKPVLEKTNNKINNKSITDDAYYLKNNKLKKDEIISINEIDNDNLKSERIKSSFKLIKKSQSTNDFQALQRIIKQGTVEKTQDIIQKMEEKTQKTEKNIQIMKQKLIKKNEFNKNISVKRKIRSKICKLLSTNTVFVCEQLIHKLVNYI